MQCGAKTKNGGTCKSPGLENGRCRMHGGTNPGRPITHGRYSKFLPKRLAEQYEAALADPDLISVAGEAAVVQSLIANSLAELDLDQCQAMWETLDVLCKDEPDVEDMGQWIREVKNVVRDGVDEWRKVQRLLGYVEAKRKLSETEAKRMAQLDQNITAKQANLLVAGLYDLISQHVTDPESKAAISRGLIRLVS